MKSIFKKIAFVLALAMVVTAFPAKTAAAASEPWLKAKRTLYIGGDATEQYAESAWASVKKGDYSVKFASADEKIATVNAKNGRIHAVSVGETVVTATFSKDGAKDIVKECAVKVKQNAGAVELDEKSAEMTVGEKITVKATAENENTTDKLHFAPKAAADKEIIDVDYDNGEITAKAAGTATVLVYATQWEYNKDTKKWAKKVTTDKVEFTVTVKAVEFAAEATGVKEITVTGNFDKDSKFTVKKGNGNINCTATIAEDGKSAVLALSSKLTQGTYTVSCGDFSAEVVAEDERVENIIILEDKAYVATNVSRDAIYVHYDVLNQYGESVRKSYSVTWTASTGTTVNDTKKSAGVLEIPAKTGESFNYGSTIILTAVHTQGTNAKTQTATVYAGLEKRVSSVEFIGVVRDDVPTLVTLPAGFTANRYLLLYQAYDSLGYEMDYAADGDNVIASKLNFTSLDPLVLGANFTIKAGGMILDGKTYGAVYLEPGIQVNQGGVARIQVTSTQTGVSKIHELTIDAEQILTTFKLMDPDVIIAEGDSNTDGYKVTIPYEAYDQNGLPITSFNVLYKSVSLSDTALQFVEQKDGSAVLKYTVPADVQASKNVDIPRVYTSTVINTGSVSTLTLNIKDKAVPTSIKGFGSKVRTNLIEGDEETLSNTGDNGFMFYDQYDREMSNAKASATFGSRKVAVKTVGSAFSVTNAGITVDGYTAVSGGSMKIVANDDSTEGQLQQAFEFVIINENSEVESGSAKKLTMNAVDIKQVRSFALSYKNSIDSTADSKLYVDTVSTNTYVANFSVKGTLANGTVVDIPVANGAGYNYLDITADTSKVTVTSTGAITAKPTSYIASDFVDHSTTLPDSNHPNRLLDFTVVVKVNSLTASGAAFNATLKDTLTQKIYCGVDGIRYVDMGTKSWELVNGVRVLSANAGQITYDDLMTIMLNYTDNYGKVYGTNWGTWRPGFTITISKMVENENGLYSASNINSLNKPLTIMANAIALNGGSADVVMIENAERGDKFVVTYTFDKASLTLEYEVGADKTAHFSTVSETCNWR